MIVNITAIEDEFEQMKELEEEINYKFTPPKPINQGIPNLKWLQEFTREAGRNTRPWEAFQVKSEYSKWRDMLKRDLELFFCDELYFRRKPQKQKVWQWLFKYNDSSRFELTGNKYPSKESAQHAIRKFDAIIISHIEESEEEVEVNDEEI